MSTHCPACKKVLKKKALPSHIKGCLDWNTKIGVPSSEFNFDEYFQRGLYEPQLIESVDYLSCKICGYRKKRIADHVRKVHGYDAKDYRAKYNALTSIPKTNEKRKATVKERYGVENVFQDESVKEKMKETNLKRYGVEQIAHSDEVKEKRKATNLKRYGVENGFASEIIKERIKKTNLERYGVEHPNQCAEHRERTKATNLERYGTEHYLQTDEFQEKRINTCLERYGLPFAPSSVANRSSDKPNKLESYFDSITPERLVYTGNFSYWLRESNRARNPDFIYLSESQYESYVAGIVILNDLRVYKVVEVFGDYWHGESKTGKSNEEHEAEVVDYYARCGVSCLVIWEGEIRSDEESVIDRFVSFLTS